MHLLRIFNNKPDLENCFFFLLRVHFYIPFVAVFLSSLFPVNKINNLIVTIVGGVYIKKDTKSIKLSSCATEQSSSFSDLKSNNDHEVIQQRPTL